MASQLESILSRLDLKDLAPVFAAQAVDDSLLPGLTDENLQALGVDKLGHRLRLLAAFAEVPATLPPPPAPDPRRATRENPFVSGLGIPFVPVPGCQALFAIWTVRVRDYRAYCQARGLPYPACDYEQGDDHPAVNVTWGEARAFAEWATGQDRPAGRLRSDWVYRLPQDLEWSAAVGLPEESGRTPAERSGRIRQYPWGRDFPPPPGAGNYHRALGRDAFPETAPVGSFPANAFGIHDLGGNVWEWCLDEFDRESDRRVLRGGSCFNDDDEYLLSSYRDRNAPGNRRNNNGFRLVLAPAREREPWF